jgi:hypothetical protein
MIKNLLVLITILLINTLAIANEKKNCKSLSKLSKEYYSCKSQGLSLTPNLKNFKEKKTLADFFKKKEK